MALEERNHLDRRQFRSALNPSSAIKRRQYGVIAVMKRVMGRDVMDQRPLRIAHVAYNRNLHRVRIYLARPYKGTVKVIVYPGLVGRQRRG